MEKKLEIENRRAQLLSELERHPEGLLYSNLEVLLNRKKRTIASDIEELRKTGSDIVIKKNRVILKNKGDVIKHSNKQSARRLALLIQADQNALPVGKYRKTSSSVSIQKSSAAEISKKRIDTRDKTKEADLTALCDKGMLQLVGKQYKLGWNAPKNIYLKDYEFEIIFQAIKENSQGYVYRKTLEDAAEQILDTMQYKLLYDESELQASGILMEKKQISDSVMDNLVRIFGKVDFRHNWLQINYMIDEKATLRTIAVGMLLYSIDHAKVYLLGKEYFADGSEENTILDVQKIHSAVETTQEHAEYLSSEFFEIYDEMYSISIEPCQDVEVVFDDVFNIREKVERLCHSRAYATMVLENGKIIYRDKIRGINDFAKYLRGYGMACTAIRPNSLVEIMYQSACRIYNLYQDEEADNHVFPEN